MNARSHDRKQSNSRVPAPSGSHSKRVKGCIFMVLLFLLPAGSAYACQGQDLQTAKQIIEQIYTLGVQIGNQIGTGQVDMLSAMQYMIAELHRINGIAAQLPYSCQLLVQQWSNSIGQAMGGGGYGGGTNCAGGVCCDNSGCF
jgi:hypothetical protein